jgi:glycosyltransferase involved in cell wall biosynthesis/tetratricopeptide (TPR) repeat protein
MSLRYLIGPVTADRARLWQDARLRNEVVSFGPSGVDLLLQPGDRWERILQRLPSGWQPDLLVLDLGSGVVPAWCWDAPLPVVALAPGWPLQWHAFRRLLPRCELVFADPPGVEVMHRAGILQARAGHLFGIDPRWLAQDLPEEDRDIDLLFFCPQHPAGQVQRMPWLARLGSLADRWRVRIEPDLPGSDHQPLLRRSRIVFHHSAAGQRPSGPGEALAAGCLVFCHRTNPETALLRDGEECVFCDEQDLESLADCYLADKPRRRQIARAGQGRASEFSFGSFWKGMADTIEQEWPALQQRRQQRPAWSREDELLVRTWQALGAGREADPGLPSALAAALLGQPGAGTRALPAALCASLQNALGILLVGPGAGGRISGEDAQRAAPHFQRAVAADPCHVVAALNLIECLIGLERTDLAVQGARQLFLGLLRVPGDPLHFDAPTFPPLLDHLRVEWERAAWEHADDPRGEVEAKRALLRWRLHTLLGQLTGDLAHFHEAALARPDLPTSRVELGLALGQAQRHVEAAGHLSQAEAANPLDRPAAYNLFVALHQVGDPLGARRVARRRRQLRRAAPDLVPAEDWFQESPPLGDELASVLVLCCNAAEVSRLCFDSLLRHTRSPWELIVVDNGSTDETPRLLEELRRQPGPLRVEVVTNEKNVGYPAGCNQALSRARGDWIVFLNNDTVLTPGWLEGLIGWACHDWPKVGLVGPVTNASRPPQEIPVSWTGLDDLPAFAANLQRQQAGQGLRVERLTGFCLLARRDVLDQVGGHEECYGIGFFEDDDLCVRVRRAGYDLVVAQDVFVHHFGSRTFQALGLDTRQLLAENFQRFLDRWGEQEAAGYLLPAAFHPGTGADIPVVVGGGEPARASLCLIVKNEEANIGDCLRSARGLFQEIVVVDTGSTDRTRELAREQGALVFEFPWVDSFAAARNACLDHATGDFIFWLDADDRLDDENRRKLQSLLGSLRSGQRVAYTLKCLCLPDPETGTATVVDHVRLFPRLPGVRWRYRVHEQILGSLRENGVAVEWADVVVHHTGYQDAALRGRKLQRDLRLLELERQEQPDEPFVLFNLGCILHEQGQYRDALPVLQRSLERSHPKDSIVRKLYALIAQCLARLGQMQEGLQVLARGRQIEPDDAELLFLEGGFRRDTGDLAGARACFRALLEGPAPGQHFASVADGLRSHRARHELALVCWIEGDLTGAEDQWRQVLAARPDFLPACQGLAEVLERQNRWVELEALAEPLRQIPRAEAGAERLRCRSLLGQGRHQEARVVAEEMVRRWPNQVSAWEQLSHALLQQGSDLAAAERCLREILRWDPRHAQAQHNLSVLLAQLEHQAGEAAFQEVDLDLARRYHRACLQPSDINEHLATLAGLARGCRHVTVMGTRNGISTTALLYARPQVVVCYDRVRHPEVDELARLAGRTELVFHQEDVLGVDIEPTDLLFIDTWHVYDQLRAELQRHGEKARKYIVLHDTTTFGEVGESEGHRGLWPAMEEFLKPGTFRLQVRYENNNGLTVLERVSAGYSASG